ncbi:hypothetical protein [Bifidobacterium phasiani]|uniref:Lipoprotein n=1 Tax=Bifidobacterium phasiani TaxID=2834431 RepID=A0ABS6W9I3_9BIFI|nr:hypothetical protein [Bifidobacterium phasiani]MBW3083149.1 hypothetical protein [Bifidobacterium phasiani]
MVAGSKGDVRRGHLARLWCGTVCAVVLVLSGCASSVDPSDEAANAPSEATGQPSKANRLADSLQAYIDQTLEREEKGAAQGDPFASSPEALEMLRQAQAEGAVSLTNYERAWSNYRQCVVDKGQPEPMLIRYANGLYTKAGIGGGTREQIDAFLQATDECEYREVLSVQHIYAVQTDNPNLYSDPSVGIVDCLHRYGVVPDDYTAVQFMKEDSAFEYSFDDSDPDVRSCYAANNRLQVNCNEPGDCQDLSQ